MSKRHLTILRLIKRYKLREVGNCAVNLGTQSLKVLREFFYTFKNSCADIIYISFGSIQAARAFICSCQELLLNYGIIWILFDDESKESEYQELQFYKNVQVRCTKNKFSEVVQSCIQASAEHIIMIQEGMRAMRQSSLSDCIEKMERAFAYGFFLGIDHASLDKLTLNEFSQELFAWGFGYGKDDRQEYNNCKRNSLQKIGFRKTNRQNRCYN